MKNPTLDEQKIEKELALVDTEKSKQIKKWFSPMIAMLEAMESEYEEIINMEMTPETSSKARELRLRIRDVRTQADKVRKNEKQKYLVAGNAIQGVYNVLLYAVTEKEEKLKDIEEFQKRQEEARLKALQEERERILYDLDVENVRSLDLSGMTDDVWETYLAGVQAKYNEKKQKEEEERKAAEIAQKKRELFEKRKVELMKWAQFRPFDLLTPETDDQEYQIIVETMKFREEKWNEEQLRIKQENEQLRKEKIEAEKKLEEERKKLESEKKMNEIGKLFATHEGKVEKHPVTEEDITETSEAISDVELLQSGIDKLETLLNLSKNDKAVQAFEAAIGYLKLALMMI